MFSEMNVSVTPEPRVVDEVRHVGDERVALETLN